MAARRLRPAFPCGCAPRPVRAAHAIRPTELSASRGRSPGPSALHTPPNSRLPVTARENPFATCHLERIPFRFPAGVDWNSLLKRLEELNWCASFVGGHGTGKTTLVDQLIPHLTERGFEPVVFRLQTESGMKEKDRLADKLREVRKPGFILLDGAEQLSTRQWLPIRAAASEAAGFIVTVHRTSRLPVAVELETSAKLLESLVGHLTGGKLPDDEAEALFHRHRGNLRDCLRELYDRWAG
jgi:hypothetical protein